MAGFEPKKGPLAGLSGIMRGMNEPEIKPAPSVPWYRAIVTRTPRGRKLRRRTLTVLALCTAPWWPMWFGLDLKVLSWKLGLRPMPSDVFDYCRRDSECTAMRCRYGGQAVCVPRLDKDPSESAGKCTCSPPAGCRDLRATSPGGGIDWECLGGMELDGGGGREGGP